MRVEPPPADDVAARREEGRAAVAGGQRAGEQDGRADPAAELGVEPRACGGRAAHSVTGVPFSSTATPSAARSSSMACTSRMRGTF